MRKTTKKWTQKDGSKIRICDMSDSHLQNTIKMLERKAQKDRNDSLDAAYSISCMVQGEMASYYIENNIDSMEEDIEGERFLPDIYWNLIKEQERREYLKAQEICEKELLDDCVVGGCDRYGSLQN